MNLPGGDILGEDDDIVYDGEVRRGDRPPVEVEHAVEPEAEKHSEPQVIRVLDKYGEPLNMSLPPPYRVRSEPLETMVEEFRTVLDQLDMEYRAQFFELPRYIQHDLQKSNWSGRSDSLKEKIVKVSLNII